MLTVILLVVAPVDHKYEVLTLEVNVTLPPAQKAVGPPAVIVGVAGKAFIVIPVAADEALWHPFASVT